MILFFSGTGNSEYAAKRIGDALEDRVISINDRVKNNDLSPIAADRMVVCTPTHCWRIPKTVEEWMMKVEFPENIPVWFVMTCGSDIGNADKYIRDLCRRKNLNYMGVQPLVMPENYIAMFNAPAKDKAIEIIRKAEPVLEAAIRRIRRGLSLTAPDADLAAKIKSGPVNPQFYKHNVKDKDFVVDERCVGCGLCVKNCPVNNLELIYGRPYWKGNCIHCMSCICRCPQEAIEYGKVSLGKPRYTCPL